MLISINVALLCNVTKLVSTAIFKQNNFFKFYFKNVNVFVLSYFEPNFIEKFNWESGFSNFGHVTIFAK